MLAKHLALALVGTALVSAPALAQSQPSTTTTTSTTMSTTNWMTQEQPGQWRASKLEGVNVYNNNNEKIGDISELIVDQSGKVQAVVIGVGGFLGMGEHDVAVPFDQVKFMTEPRTGTTASTTTGTTGTTTATGPATTSPNAPATTGSVAPTDRSAPDHAVLNMTKDQLKAAPEFKYSRR